MVLSRTVAGSNIDKFGPRRIVLAGCVIVAAATVPFAFAGPHTSSWLLSLWLPGAQRTPPAEAAPGAQPALVASDRQAGADPVPEGRRRLLAPKPPAAR